MYFEVEGHGPGKKCLRRTRRVGKVVRGFGGQNQDTKGEKYITL